jgi:putative membrane protein
MTALALIFAGLAALLHVLFFKLESLDWRKPKTWKTFGLESQADADTTASLAFNQGFYNLFLAIGAAAGIVIVAASDTRDTIGWTLIIFACGSMLGAALVLISSGGKAFARAAAIQGGPALIAVVAGVIAAS